MLSFPQNFAVVEGAPLAADAAGRTGDYISLKNCHKVTIIVSITQGNAAVVPITIEQASAVAGTGSKPITEPVPIWSNLDTAASPTLVRRTNAVSYTTDAALKNKQVIFEIDPASLDINNGFDCLTVKTGASNAANLTGVLYILHSRFQGPSMPSTIID